jgi:hypothetical protein
MAELKNRQWLLASRPVGMVKESDFRWSESTVPAATPASSLEKRQFRGLTKSDYE